MKFLQNSNESHTEKDEISVEEEKMFIKRSTISFISAGVACSILSFGALAYITPPRLQHDWISDNIPDDAIAIQYSEAIQPEIKNQIESNIVKTGMKTIVTEANSSSVSISPGSNNGMDSPQTTLHPNGDPTQCHPKTENPDSTPQPTDPSKKPTQASSPNEETATEKKDSNQKNNINNDNSSKQKNPFAVSPEEPSQIPEQNFPFKNIDQLTPKKD